MVTVVTLKPLSTGAGPDDQSNQPFYVMNTHFDNVGQKGTS
jgi:hypothetical protein